MKCSIIDWGDGYVDAQDSQALGYATGLIAVVCLFGVALVMIDVTSVPKLGTTNRLANSDFEQGVSGPFNWGFSTARPDLLSAQWSEALRGKGVSSRPLAA